MKTRRYNSTELWFALGLLALNLSFVIERYAPPSDMGKFAQGLLMGLSIATNVLAIILLTARLKQRDKEDCHA
jgi:hypothetical protein